MKKMTEKEFNSTINWVLKNESYLTGESNNNLTILYHLLQYYRDLSEEYSNSGFYGMSNGYTAIADRLHLILKERGFWEDLEK